MAATDNPLKQLVEAFAADFAAWLLKAEVREVHTLNVELPASLVRVDQLLRVTLATGRAVKLHLEFQGLRSHEPMPRRMLDYIVRLVNVEPELDLFSVVIYVGQGAGLNDQGEHTILGADGEAILRWRYQVIRLWQMSAEELFALERPALLALIGQTRVDEPERILPQLVERLHRVEDATLRGRLFTGLMALVDDQELLTMIEKLVETDEWLIDSPFLQRIREKAAIKAMTEGLAKGHTEGLAKGHTEGLAEGQATGITKGLAEGLEKGREEGVRLALAGAILNVLAWRFNPPILTFQQVETQITAVKDAELLNILLRAATEATEFATFQATLQQLTEQKVKN